MRTDRDGRDALHRVRWQVVRCDRDRRHRAVGGAAACLVRPTVVLGRLLGASGGRFDLTAMRCARAGARCSARSPSVANHSSRLISTTKPSGISGMASSSGRLQTGQGAPAAPQPQARGPSQGLSVWTSHTQRTLSQRRQNLMLAGLIMAILQAPPCVGDAPTGRHENESLTRLKAWWLRFFILIQSFERPPR
jgi:hypothetical protein